MSRLWKKLLKAWTRGKEKKAVKLQHKLIKEELKRKDNMSQIELACKDAVFHFNKKHLEDPTIPMWVIKTRGETYYVDHVECNVSWNTKETPESNHTKGSIKVKNCLVTIDDDNCATISVLTEQDKNRLTTQKKLSRLITSYGKQLLDTLKELEVEHGEIKKAGGGCGTLWYIVEIYDFDQVYQLKFAMSGTDLRILAPNEDYYKLYGSSKSEYIDDEGWDDLYEE